MLGSAYAQLRKASMRLYLLLALVAVLGASAGVGLTWLCRDPHTTTAEHLRGTVTWSNAADRIIAFEADGQVRDPLDGATIYHVISDEMNYPSCLAGQPGDPVREDRRRVEIDAIHQGFDGRQKSNFAVSVLCLN